MVRAALLIAAASFTLLSCESSTPEPAAPAEQRACGVGGAPMVGVITELRFGREVDGATLGFDLDGHVTADGDGDGCGLADHIDPDGVPGIDNGMLRLLPALEATQARVVEDLVQQSIAEGELLLLPVLEGLDNLDSGCARGRLVRGAGDPLLGTDGLILPGQTFEEDIDQPSADLGEVRLEGGTLEVHDFAFQIPMQVFNAVFTLDIASGGIRIHFNEDGTFTGFMAGPIDTETIVDIVSTSGVGSDVRALIDGLIGSVADMEDEDGNCTKLSVTLVFSGVTAFLFED